MFYGHKDKITSGKLMATNFKNKYKYFIIYFIFYPPQVQLCPNTQEEIDQQTDNE